MKVLSCGATRRRLHAFHDEELPIGDQIAVSAHLEWCDPCAAAFDELRQLRDVLRRMGVGRMAMSLDDDESFERAVVTRARAERRTPPSAWLRDAIRERHLVYACGGAVLAAVVCLVITMAMVRFAFGVDQDSVPAPPPVQVAADIPLAPEDPYYYLAVLGSNQNPVSVGAQVRMPRPLDSGFSPYGVDGPDYFFTLTAVVTREGRVTHPELLETGGARRIGRDSKAAEDLLGSLSKARFEPASMAGLPVAVNMVWLVARTTVRASSPSLELPQPAPKKRRVLHEARALPTTISI